jgi:hypothetical protein
VREIRLYLAQSLALFIRSPAFRYVHQNAHEFADIAGRVENRMSYSVHVFSRAVWKNDPEMRLEILSFAIRPLSRFNDPSTIFRMHALYKFFE